MDAFIVALSWYLAYLLRFNFSIPVDHLQLATDAWSMVLGIKLFSFYVLKLYKGMWRYTSVDDLFRIFLASGLCSLVIISALLYRFGHLGLSRSVFIIDFLLTFILISASRFSVRFFFQVIRKDPTFKYFAGNLLPWKRRLPPKTKNLLIIGAGDYGEKIFREIRDNSRLRYRVVGFVDDDQSKIGRQIHGIPVLGPTSDIGAIARRLNAGEVLIAISSLSSREMRAIVSACEASDIPFKTLPGMGELIDGNVSLRAVREVAYRDLLGREVIHLDEQRIGSYLDGARVMVTGAGGSIGSELCRQICRFRPASLILFEQAESPLYEIEMEMTKRFSEVDVIPLLADIRNRHQLLAAFEAHAPQVVFHAAAYKHVPMLEAHPWAAVHNNVIGTRNVVDFAHRFGVERFVFVSTDKAVRPSNAMGASKRAAELLVQSQNLCRLSPTRFITVRFGNVVGSVGSVVPLFKKQIESGGPVTVTHPDVIRYFMTIPEACQLILQAGAMGKGGEIFILDMGRPVKILDMARDLITMSGFEPDTDIAIEFIGLRPGEKLYEELITEGENIVPTRHQKIMVLRGQSCNPSLLNGNIDTLARLADAHDGPGIRAKLREIVPEYVTASAAGRPESYPDFRPLEAADESPPDAPPPRRVAN